MSDSNETKVYIFNCDKLQDMKLFERCYNLMPKYRKEKIDSLRFYEDKRLSLGAGILLSRFFSSDDLDNIMLEGAGKPYLQGSELNFNLSHSKSLAMLALSKNRVGCDVQFVEPVSMKVAKRFFNDNEYKLISEAESEEERTALFFRLWTLKESFMKATGLGMSLPLNKFEIGFKEGTPFVEQKVNNKEYSFKEYNLELPYYFSVCAEGKTEFAEKTEEIEI